MSEYDHIDKIRQDFIANVSHELRTPLTVFQGYCETLLNEVDEHPWQPILKQMHQQSQRMNQIVQDLLLLAQLESGIDAQKPQSVHVPELLSNIIHDAKALNPTHAFSHKIDNSLMIQGCRNELQSAFTNLVVNAVRYTPDYGEIKITWEKQGDFAVFKVKDTGIGIAEKHLPRLTERFYRVDKARSRDSGGTGLGLAIVKHVLLRHDAQLNIKSIENHGSEFICRFSLGKELKP